MAYDLNKWVLNERKPIRRRPWVPSAIIAAIVWSLFVGILECLDPGGADERDMPGIFSLALPFFVAIVMSPFARDAWVGPRQAAFDEFESLALARASRRALNVTLFATLSLFAWFWASSMWDWPMPHTPLDWASLGLALFFSACSLPILFAELAVPIPPDGADDEEDV